MQLANVRAGSFGPYNANQPNICCQVYQNLAKEVESKQNEIESLKAKLEVYQDLSSQMRETNYELSKLQKNIIVKTPADWKAEWYRYQTTLAGLSLGDKLNDAIENGYNCTKTEGRIQKVYDFAKAHHLCLEEKTNASPKDNVSNFRHKNFFVRNINTSE